MTESRRHFKQDEASRRSLRWRWAATAIVYTVGILIGWSWLRGALSEALARQWALLGAVVLLYILVFLWRRLPTNRADERGKLHPIFGWGSNLSLFRGLLIGFLAGFLFSERPSGWLAWLPAILYITNAILDMFDGYLARVSDHQTMLGESLDLELDALGLLIAVSLGIGYGSLPVWFLPIGLARYAFAAGIGLRKRRDEPVYDLPPSRYRRAIAGITMGFLGVMLWPIVGPPGSRLASGFFFLPIAASFIRDWLVVSGAIDPDSATYQHRIQRIEHILGGWLPVLLRAMALATLAPLVFAAWAALVGNSEFALILGLLVGELVLWILTMMATLGLALVTVGYAARIGSLVLLLPLGLWITATELDGRSALALFSVMGVLILGSGYASLREADRALFMRQVGERDG